MAYTRCMLDKQGYMHAHAPGTRTHITGSLLYTYDGMLLCSFHGKKCFRKKVLDKIERHFFMFSIFLLKIVLFMR